MKENTRRKERLGMREGREEENLGKGKLEKERGDKETRKKSRERENEERK